MRRSSLRDLVDEAGRVGRRLDDSEDGPLAQTCHCAPARAETHMREERGGGEMVKCSAVARANLSRARTIDERPYPLLPLD